MTSHQLPTPSGDGLKPTSGNGFHCNTHTPSAPVAKDNGGVLSSDDVQQTAFDSIEDALAAYAAGNFVIVLDDPSRENEGDLVIAAEKVTAAKMAFMVRHTSGVICAPLLPSRCQELRLPLMVPEAEHTEAHGTKYTISVDAKAKTTTGISAHDRTITCNLLSDPKVTADHFVRPGHMFPLRYTPGGVLKRRGHTEASVDMCRLAGLYPAGVISEIVLDDGRMARRDDLFHFAAQHHLKIITVEALVQYIQEKTQREGLDWTLS